MLFSLEKLLTPRAFCRRPKIRSACPHAGRRIRLIYHNGDISMERDNMMHGARSALNANMEIRAWAEEYLKIKTRAEMPELSDEEFEKHWKYHKPEIMHAGATEAMAAYRNRSKD